VLSFGKNADECRYAELGSIRVPTHLENKSKVEITMTVLLKGVFAEAKDGEFVVVDIPYLTEKFDLLITAEEGAIRVASNNFLDAYANNNSFNTDADEVASQKRKCTPYNGKFIWKTTYPKLGYRYVFKYYVTDD